MESLPYILKVLNIQWYIVRQISPWAFWVKSFSPHFSNFTKASNSMQLNSIKIYLKQFFIYVLLGFPFLLLLSLASKSLHNITNITELLVPLPYSFIIFCYHWHIQIYINTYTHIFVYMYLRCIFNYMHIHKHLNIYLEYIYQHSRHYLFYKNGSHVLCCLLYHDFIINKYLMEIPLSHLVKA